MNDKRGKQNNRNPRSPNGARGGAAVLPPAAASQAGHRPASAGMPGGRHIQTGAPVPRLPAISPGMKPPGKQQPPGRQPRGQTGTPAPSGVRRTNAQTPRSGNRPIQRNSGAATSKTNQKRPPQPNNKNAQRRPPQKSARKRVKNQGQLHIQNTAERRKNITQRRGKTPEQLEYIRRRSGIQRFYIKQRRISAIMLFFTRLLTLVVVYVLIFAVSSGLFVLGLRAPNRKAGEDVVYQLGDNKKDAIYKVETLPYRSRVRSGQLYLNFSELADYFGFVTTGDVNTLRFLTKYKGGEEVIFEVGTGSVTVNGSMMRMYVPSYSEGDALYVPLDFIKTYIKGISVGINEKNGRLVLYREYTLDTKGEKVFDDITFTLKPQNPTEHIDENTLPADIKIATEPGKKPESGTPDTSEGQRSDDT